MINIGELLNTQKITITYIEPEIDGGKIQDFRESQRMSIAALANVMCVSSKTVKQWESNEKELSKLQSKFLYLLINNPKLINEFRKIDLE